MGWANCGEDSKGRPIGYAHAATCDHPGCDKTIDRGLGYACGGMHGKHPQDGAVDVCEGYFCGDHMRHVAVPDGSGGSTTIQVCHACDAEIEEIKAQAYREVLAMLTQPVPEPADFTGVGHPPEAPTPVDHRLKHIYDVLLAWDETEGVVLDARYMPQAQFDRLTQWRGFLAEARGRATA